MQVKSSSLHLLIHENSWEGEGGRVCPQMLCYAILANQATTQPVQLNALISICVASTWPVAV